MKILVSTKNLANTLGKIPKGEYVERVNMERGTIIFITQSKSIEMPVEILEFGPTLEQEGSRWDWVHQLMNQVNEQPVSIKINRTGINILFQY